MQRINNNKTNKMKKKKQKIVLIFKKNFADMPLFVVAKLIVAIQNKHKHIYTQ